MDIKGVCYDVGRVYPGSFLTRRVFDPAATRRELQIIRDDLHCNAVRFQGTDIGRLMTAATDALKLGGLQVWFSPELFDKSREETLAYLVQAATTAEPLREQFPGQLVFCVGTESVMFEVVDWRLFDYIGIDHYRNSKIEHRYAERIAPYLGQGKPVINTEFGHSSYRGNRPGHMEFGEVDLVSLALSRMPLAGRLVRPRVKKGTHVRDEEHQARELTKTLGILDAEGVDGAFVWTFADPWLTHTADPRHDLDMTATSLVKTYARGHGTTYPDLPWEPKQAFGAVAGFYAAH
jgi:hypothetical protein